MPGIYQGTYIDTKHTEIEKLIAHINNERVSRASQRKQLDLLQALNQQHQSERPHDPQLEARIQSFELAYRMQQAAPAALPPMPTPTYEFPDAQPASRAAPEGLLLPKAFSQTGPETVVDLPAAETAKNPKDWPERRGKAGVTRMSPATLVGSRAACIIAMRPPIELPTRITGSPTAALRNP